MILAALRFARAILSFSCPKSLRSKHRRTIKNENFILRQFEDEKIVSRLVEILELGHLETLKVAAFEIITKIAATSNSSKILDAVGTKLLHHLLKTLQKSRCDVALVVAATKCLATLLEGDEMTKKFVLLNSGLDQLQSTLEIFLKPANPSHDHSLDAFQQNSVTLSGKSLFWFELLYNEQWFTPYFAISEISNRTK